MHHNVLDGEPAPPPKKGADPQIFGPCLLWPHGWMDQDRTWHGCRPQPRRPCGVIWGHSPLPKKEPPKFSAHVYCAQTVGCITMPLGMEVGASAQATVLDGDPASPPLKVHSPQFLSNVRCGQTTGWMKTPLGTEVDLGPGHIVLDGVPALRERGTAAPIFSAHACCGHGRPSQLLLSSCFTSQRVNQHSPVIDNRLTTTEIIWINVGLNTTTQPKIINV